MVLQICVPPSLADLRLSITSCVLLLSISLIKISTLSSLADISNLKFCEISALFKPRKKLRVLMLNTHTTIFMI